MMPALVGAQTGLSVRVLLESPFPKHGLRKPSGDTALNEKFLDGAAYGV